MSNVMPEDRKAACQYYGYDDEANLVYWGNLSTHRDVERLAKAFAAHRQATASSLAAENARLKTALGKIAAGTKVALENGDEWPSPLGARHSQDIARAALQGE